MCVPGEQSDAAAREEQKLELAQAVLRAGNTIQIRAFGTSMLPTIWPGDVLAIESASLNGFACGDLVLIETQNGIRVHRLIEKSDSCCVTRGDAMPQDDPEIKPDQVLGRVLEIYRRNRVLTPRRQVQGVNRLLAWLLSRSQTFCNIALLADSALHGSNQSAKNPLRPTSPIVPS